MNHRGNAPFARHRERLEQLRARVAQMVFGAALGLWPQIAAAQETLPAPAPVVDPAPPAPEPKVAPVPAEKPAPSPPPPPAAAPAPPKKTDHENIVGAWGLGYVGSSQVPLPIAMPIGRSDQAGLLPNDRINKRTLLVPAIGVRKWVTKRFGLDAGFGMTLSAGATTAKLGTAEATADKESVFAMSLRAGIPIMMLDTQHMSFLVAPEATFAWAWADVAPLYEDYAPPNAKLRGAALDVGLRAGAELYFGFMGLPRLALQAGVGVYLSTQWASATVANQSVSDHSVGLGFVSDGNPWGIFTGFTNVAARYYF